MKISLLLPYWNRQEAANKALESLKQYSNLDLEIIIIDDGCEIPFDVPRGLPVKVIRLPKKKEPKSPVTAWNEGVKAATGDVLVLSCIEVIHEKQILEELTKDLGDDDYRLASAWCPEEERWHAHSTVDVPDCPKGSALSFCAALKPELYWRAGGFDEDYREGAGYEDRDFILRLHRAGANFQIRDDLKVIHPKSGATIHWGQEKFDRNLKLYREKWPFPPITFVCLNAGNYCDRGADYVNILADMVKRNMPPFVRWRFVCLTDDNTGLDSDIEVLPLPEDLEGWWGKLYLFKKGLFPEGERIVFFDLDTLIVGPLDKLLSYQGDMAILRDFYWPSRGAPGVIMWKSGYGHFIWDEWLAQGRPKNELGDLGWIENLDQGRFTKTLDRLQDLYPDLFVSYKVHCKPFPPAEASVVCFHGQPKPHNSMQKWVDNVWKIDGASTLNFKVAPNTPSHEVLQNVIANENAAPWLKVSGEHRETAIICGSGPSLEDNIGLIKLYRSNVKIFALNNAAKILHEHDIVSDFQVLLDPRPQNVEFVEKQYARKYLIASQVHPSVFEFLKGREVYQWHPAIDGIDKLFPEKNMTLIGGGLTVGLCTMALSYAMGFRRLMLFGYDSSYRGDQSHAIPQSRTEKESWTFDITVRDRTFKSNAAMAKQAEQFKYLAADLANNGNCEINVFGDGLLPYIAQLMSQPSTT